MNISHYESRSIDEDTKDLRGQAFFLRALIWNIILNHLYVVLKWLLFFVFFTKLNCGSEHNAGPCGLFTWLMYLKWWAHSHCWVNGIGLAKTGKRDHTSHFNRVCSTNCWNWISFLADFCHPLCLIGCCLWVAQRVLFHIDLIVFPKRTFNENDACLWLPGYQLEASGSTPTLVQPCL